MTNEKKEAPLAEVPKEIIIHNSQLSNFDPAQQVEFAQKAAKALMVIIDATKPLIMQGKRYLYFEHWQTVARFFNTTVGIESTTQTDKGYIAKAVVYNKEGVIIGGAEASCMKDERNWVGKPDFQLRSMAQTRAMTKALRSIYGFVAVLAGVSATPAEEMEDMPKEQISRPISQNNASSEAPKATDKQKWLITKLCRDKSITKDQMLKFAEGRNASELIKTLMDYQPNIQDEDINLIVPN